MADLSKNKYSNTKEVRDGKMGGEMERLEKGIKGLKIGEYKWVGRSRKATPLPAAINFFEKKLDIPPS